MEAAMSQMGATNLNGGTAADDGSTRPDDTTVKPANSFHDNRLPSIKSLALPLNILNNTTPHQSDQASRASYTQPLIARPNPNGPNEHDRSIQQTPNASESLSSQAEDESTSIHQWDPNLLNMRGIGIWATKNGYWESADKIGLDHGFPNIGHMGRYFQPKCWKPSNPPLTEAHADELHKQNRRAAQLKLDRAILKLEQAPDGDMKKATRGQLQTQWHSTRQIHDLVHRARVELARDFASYLEGGPSTCYTAAQRSIAIPQEVNRERQKVPKLRLNTDMSMPIRHVDNTAQNSGTNMPSATEPFDISLAPQDFDVRFLPNNFAQAVQMYSANRSKIAGWVHLNENLAGAISQRFGSWPPSYVPVQDRPYNPMIAPNRQAYPWPPGYHQPPNGMRVFSPQVYPTPPTTGLPPSAFPTSPMFPQEMGIPQRIDARASQQPYVPPTKDVLAKRWAQQQTMRQGQLPMRQQMAPFIQSAPQEHHTGLAESGPLSNNMTFQEHNEQFRLMALKKSSKHPKSATEPGKNEESYPTQDPAVVQANERFRQMALKKSSKYPKSAIEPGKNGGRFPAPRNQPQAQDSAAPTNMQTDNPMQRDPRGGPPFGNFVRKTSAPATENPFRRHLLNEGIAGPLPANNQRLAARASNIRLGPLLGSRPKSSISIAKTNVDEGLRTNGAKNVEIIDLHSDDGSPVSPEFSPWPKTNMPAVGGGANADATTKREPDSAKGKQPVQEGQSIETPYAPTMKPASSGVAETALTRKRPTNLRIVTSSRPPDGDCLPSETATKGAVEADVDEESNSDNDQPLVNSKRRNIIPDAEEESDSDDDQPLINSKRRNVVSGNASQLDADPATAPANATNPVAPSSSSAPLPPSTKPKKTTPTPTPQQSVNANDHPKNDSPARNTRKRRPSSPTTKPDKRVRRIESQTRLKTGGGWDWEVPLSEPESE